MKTVITNGAIHDGAALHLGSALVIEDDLIIDLLPANDAAIQTLPQHDLNGGTLVPGWIDIQVNGGGGVLFNDAPNVDGIVKIAAAHRKFGTTALLPTLITADIETMLAAIAAVKQAMAEGVPGVLGIHLEGPFLSPTHAGIHDPSKFLVLDDDLVNTIVTATDAEAGETKPIVLMTIAPECTNLRLITKLREHGIVVFAGHSGATFEQTNAALAAGVQGFTHLFNAMSPFQSRAPGMVGAALADQNSWQSIIADGIHVHPSSVAIAVAAKPINKTILVTDAMAGVGSALDHFYLDGEKIFVADSSCRNAAGTLAGSQLDMNTAVTNMMQFADVDLTGAMTMASRAPAELLGLATYGRLLPGCKASMLVLDEKITVQQSWIDGKFGGEAWKS